MMKVRFSFKALLLVFTLIAVAIGLFAVRLHRAHRQRDAAKALSEAGVLVRYEYQMGGVPSELVDPFTVDGRGPDFSPWVIELGPWAKWLGRQFGQDFVLDIKD